MITIDDLRFVMALASAPSLAAAARQLNVSPPAVTQRLRALEVRLGVRVLDRLGRDNRLTDEGEMLVEHGRTILAEIGDLDDRLAARRSEVIGHLRIMAPLGFGRRHVAPVIAAFQAAHPKLTADLVLSDQLNGVPAGSWDVAIQVGPSESAASSLIVRNLAANARFACASPTYLASNGQPATPRELMEHRCLALRENLEDVTLWRFRAVREGVEARVRIAPHLSSNDGEVVREWALAGHGIVVRSEWDVAEDLRSGRLVRILDGYSLPDAPVVALFGSSRQARASRTIRFVEALATALSPAPWRRSEPKSL